MRVLVGCEYSGRVRQAFRNLGHDAWSCDLLESDDNSKFHIQGDVLSVLNDEWDLAIFHPPCTYLTCSAEWAYEDGPYHQKISEGIKVGQERRLAREAAIDFVIRLYDSKIPKLAIENPVGVLSTRWREPDQFIQPYEYGDDASKKTCLWLRGLPKLKPTKLCMPRLAPSKDGKSFALRWGNQTDSGQNKESPSRDRWKIRSTTWRGWADAMADQWGNVEMKERLLA
jgi:hypothetical protein